MYAPVAAARPNPLAAGYGCCAAVGAFELPTLHWKQIGISVIVGLGLGYVLFSGK